MHCGNPAGLDLMKESFVREFLCHLASDFAEYCKENNIRPTAAMEEYLRCIKERLKSPPGCITLVGHHILSAIEVFIREITNALSPESTVEDFEELSKKFVEAETENVSIFPPLSRFLSGRGPA